MAASKPSVIDLRSDTVTHPTPAMRAAMAQAEVGDDVYGDDPTVNELEAFAARVFGKEAALFVSSGTQGNLLAVMSWCDQRGSEMIVGDEAHMHIYEVGGSAVVAGVHSRVVRTQADGTLRIEDIAACVRDVNVHYPTTSLVCLENTHNRMGGKVLPVSYCDAVGEFCASKNLRLHLDGARVCNASVAAGVPLDRLCAAFDSVSACLSKGLAAPVGSVLVGPAAFIAKARRFRKMLGGGMRQAGVLAAAGRIALGAMVERLAEDHAHARALASGIAALPGLSCDETGIQTNIVYFKLDTARLGLTAPALAQRLTAAGVLCNATGPDSVRFVTHYMIAAEHVTEALARLAAALAPPC